MLLRGTKGKEEDKKIYENKRKKNEEIMKMRSRGGRKFKRKGIGKKSISKQRINKEIMEIKARGGRKFKRKTKRKVGREEKYQNKEKMKK